jgi:hypothetical protein
MRACTNGVGNSTGVLLVPYILPSCSIYFASTPNSAFGDSQWKSPFDTCPATTSPISLFNLQVAVGGQNVLQSTLDIMNTF